MILLHFLASVTHEVGWVLQTGQATKFTYRFLFFQGLRKFRFEGLGLDCLRNVQGFGS